MTKITAVMLVVLVTGLFCNVVGIHMGLHYLSLHSQASRLRSEEIPIINLGELSSMTSMRKQKSRTCLVQQVNHLEDTIRFYVESFGFMVSRHIEIEGDSTKNHLASSITTIEKSDSHSSRGFSMELVYNYGKNRYQRGNEIRGLVMRNSYYLGDLEVLDSDAYGQKFLETPDGLCIILVDDDDLDRDEVSHGETIKGGTGFDQLISLYVRNLTSSVAYYTNVLGAPLMEGSDEYSAVCVWNSKSSASLEQGVAVELVQVSEGQIVDFRESQCLIKIRTDHDEITRLRNCSRNTKKCDSDQVICGSTLPFFNENSILLSDEDGHKYHFTDSLEEAAVEVDQRTELIDWEYRKLVSNRIQPNQTGMFGENVVVLDECSFETVTDVHADANVVLNFYAPWCTVCIENHPVYEELATRVSQIGGGKTVFAAVDGSRIPISTVKNEAMNSMLSWTKRMGYPTLFFIPKGNREGAVEFLGDWTMESLSSWIQGLLGGTLDLSRMDMKDPSEPPHEQ